MQALKYKKYFSFLLLSALFVGCGAKDNLVPGFEPAANSSTGQTSSLSAKNSTVNGEGETMAFSYGHLYLQKMVESARTIDFITKSLENANSLKCGNLIVDTISETSKELTFNYYSDTGTGECSKYYGKGRSTFVTTMDSTSYETYKVTTEKVDGKEVINRISLMAPDSQLHLRSGLRSTPRWYVNANVDMSRQYEATRTLCADGVQGTCYKVSSRLVMSQNEILFSPSKNAQVKFKDQNQRLDFRYDFTLQVTSTGSKILLGDGTNRMFISGTRMSFNSDRGDDYSGNVTLKGLSESSVDGLVLNDSTEGNCGYFAGNNSGLKLEIFWKRTPIRRMKRVLNISIDFASDAVVTNINTPRGKSLYMYSENRKKCENFVSDQLGPYYTDHLLFSY